MTPGAPEAALAVLDRRLDRLSSAPLAVGLSGGSDSLALLLCVLRWAQPAGRPVLALTVDHGLQADGPRWTAAAGETAHRLGAAWRPLAWTGAKPLRGLPAASRQARHALLAEAARAAGAAVLLLGHTADDLAESELIRRETPTHGRMAEWSPSPAWPEGRGVFLLRPLLACRRRDLQAWLGRQGLGWVDDPANLDPRFARSRARAALAHQPTQSPWTAGASEGTTDLTGRLGETDCSGVLAFNGAALLNQARPGAWLARGLLCVAGRTRPPAGAAVERLLAGLSAKRPLTATLAGARLESDGARVRVTRELGRTPAPPANPDPTASWVFDGRFEVSPLAPGWRVAVLAGRAAALSIRDRERLGAIAAAGRPALPVLLGPDGQVQLPAPFGAGPAKARCLVGERLAAAWGLVPDERTLEARAARRTRSAPGVLILS